MKRILLFALLCAFAVRASCATAVFVHGEGGYPCIRIPSITYCKGTLHAFAECRTKIGDGCIPTITTAKPGLQAGVCYKNSSDDGDTWSTLTWIAPGVAGGGGGNNPTVLCEEATQTILLQFNTDGGNWQMLSGDDGGHWSTPVAIDLGKYNGTYVGPGRGLQLSEKSPAPGRILFIGYHGEYEHAIVWYSDTGGKSYQLSESILEKMSESQLVEGPGGEVVANMRNNHLTSCNCRGVAISKDGGKSFGAITYDSTLISPVCMATIISTYNGSFIFANPASTSGRVHGEVRRSDNGGQSWPYSWEVTSSSGAFAYSCLTSVANQKEVGLLWETSASDCSGPSCQQLFSKYTVL